MFNLPRSVFSSPQEQSPTSKFREFVVKAIVALLVVAAIVASILAFRIHYGNAQMANYPIPPAAQPLNSTSILIFSPHPDDETLGTAGLIQQTLRAGGKVHVVFMTNGDAFRVGVSDYYKILVVKPSDYIRYGEMRQIESLAALKTLGLSADDVTFFGYPDRGLMGMWETCWMPSTPWKSYYSHATTVVYPNAPSRGAPNCGLSVLNDIIRQIDADHPTDIYVTHPTDDHPDHSASASFVVAAMHSLEISNSPWVSNVHLHYFLIHRGDWPVPQGLYPTLALAPPSAFLGLDTRWRSLSLTPHNVIVKRSALDKYDSQEEMMSRFLVSFIRTNELFGDLPESQSKVKDVEGQPFALDGRIQNWPKSNPVAEDPSGDSVLRDFQQGGDIVALYAAEDKTNLYLRVDMHGRLSREIKYSISLRPFDSAMKTIPAVQTYYFSPRSTPEGVRNQQANAAVVVWSGRSATLQLPLASLELSHPSLLFVNVATNFSRLPVDHTGYRTVCLSQ
jgi:LmbE family N-acetylglucosaminyl deacetylase